MVTVSDAPDEALVIAAQGGDDTAFAELFDRWFDRVFDVAWRIVRHRETAREVAQDVFLVAWRRLGSIEQPASFGGWLLRTSRNTALNRLERERRTVTLGNEETTMEIDRRQTSIDDPTAPLERDEHVDLVWAAAAALGERDASVLDLHLRHGLGPAELAEALGVTSNNAHQLLFRLKAKLATAIRAWVLWHHGSPACTGLAQALRAAGVTSFGADAVKVTSRHLPACEACTERQQTRLSPEAMFAAVPLVGAGAALKAEAAAALAAEGVPTGVAPTGPTGSAEPDPSSNDGASDHAQGDRPDGQGPPSGGDAAFDRDGRARRVRTVALVGAVVAVVAAVVLVRADPLGHGTPEADEIVSAAPATSTAATTSTAVAAPDASAAGSAGPDAANAQQGAGPAVATPGATGGAPAIAGPSVADPTVPATDVPPSTASPTTVPSPPTIGAFRATVTTSPSCPSSNRAIGLVWQTTGADAVTITGPGAPVGPRSPDGSAIACAPMSGALTYTLTASGPGGTATRSATA